ncbi:MAG: hypothetical protein A2V77_04030 [Anaeromyxobacter sp. RBG_16_69_14]|nr:MAG: hypothetical protein A2V77_04030 [Anaeromyxobacter sp. RBG_16_69_14]HJW76929.1 metal-dependent hydrolase [Thermoleophilia bacterium]
MSSRLVAAVVVASALPDLDVVAFRFGIPYAAQLGHRGFSHSLAFAALVALLGAGCHRLLRSGRMATFAFLFAATASHGVLDAFTNGGLGVAFFWPFSPTRYFAPIRMIQVALLTAARLLSPRGFVVLASELLWVWLPCAGLGAERRPSLGTHDLEEAALLAERWPSRAPSTCPVQTRTATRARHAIAGGGASAKRLFTAHAD